MFSQHRPPPLRIVKSNQTTQHRSRGVNGRLCLLTVCSFSFHKQVHPEGDGAFTLEVLVQDVRGLQSMKQLQCFNRKVTFASSVLDTIATSGRLITCCNV